MSIYCWIDLGLEFGQKSISVMSFFCINILAFIFWRIFLHTSALHWFGIFASRTKLAYVLWLPFKWSKRLIKLKNTENTLWFNDVFLSLIASIILTLVLRNIFTCHHIKWIIEVDYIFSCDHMENPFLVEFSFVTNVTNTGYCKWASYLN